MIEPYRITIRNEALDDLRDRLTRTRWPDPAADGGISLARMQPLVDYWRDEYDWRVHEAAINELPQFMATIDGQRIHFLHLRGRDGAIPLLMLHGWPGSFLEMLKIAPMLAGDFDVIVPSLPGYGFSSRPERAGTSNQRMSDLFAQLMSLLGYERFAAQGGDWGAGIATWLARRHPERLIAIHLNYIPGSFAPHVEGALHPDEEAFFRSRDAWVAESGAYGSVQRTRPLTLAYALNDSPAGLAAWIVEKFDEWAAPDSEITRDELLTNVTLYWLTETIHSSMRLYRESAATPVRFARGERVNVPCGIAHTPHEAPFPPRVWIERAYDVRHWTDLPRGGHFAALEAPEDLAADVRSFLHNASPA